jgi:hypothetical protein
MLSNGQNADETTFNAAFMSKSADSTTTGKIDLANAAAASGASLTNIQREINSLDAYTGRPIGTAHDATPVWVNNDVGTSIDTLKARLEALTTQFDLSTGHTHDGLDGEGGIVDLSDVSGLLTIAKGGTGQVTAQAAIDALVPTQAGNAAKVLTTDGTNVSWGFGASFIASTFSGTTIILSGATFQKHYYNGGSAQTLTAISGTDVDGTILNIIGSSDSNTITIDPDDSAGGILINGSWTGYRGSLLSLQYDSNLNRYLEVCRT